MTQQVMSYETKTYIEDVNMEDPRDVMASLSHLSQEYKVLPFENALNMYKIGMLINKGNLAPSIRAASVLINIPYVTLNKARRIAKHFDSDIERFTQYCKEHDLQSWNAVLADLLPRGRDLPSLTVEKFVQRAMTALRKLLAAEGDPDGTREGLIRELRFMRRLLDRQLPPDNEISDVNYLRYHSCCCCDAYPPPPGGYSLRAYKGDFSIKYPICEECIAASAEPQTEKLFLLYAHYALSLEGAYAKLASGY